MRKELVMARRRWAELSEVEAQGKLSGITVSRISDGIRTTEELMSAIDLMKTHLNPQPKKGQGKWREEPEKSKGLATHIEDCGSIGDNFQVAMHLHENFGAFVVSGHQKFIL